MLHLLCLHLTGSHSFLDICLDLGYRLQALQHGLRASEELPRSLLALFDEEVVDLLEGQILRLGVAVEWSARVIQSLKSSHSPEVHERDEGKVGAHEDKVGLPFELFTD